ncbi:MAG: transglycosylase domain-containing protein [Clostridia bacterium]|nr:transglycosylase domain-containing protein [Clostridia bacterium]
MTRDRHSNKELVEFLEKYESGQINIDDILNKENILEEEEEVQPVHQRRRHHIIEDVKEPGKLWDKFEHLIGADDDDLKGIEKVKKKKQTLWRRLLKLCLIVCAVGVLYCAVIIVQAPSIDADNINSLLNVSSTIYDDEGEAVDNVFQDQKRTIIEYDDLPNNLINSFIALEDKTFFKHHGFNIVRIFGAIKDALFTGHISGTSTITQQLARNVFLSDRMTERSINRKIVEAYYTIIIESHLSKEDIITAYLNTIYLGYGCYGVETAAESYFGCETKNLTLAECAALAALPQAPDSYALVQACDTGQIAKGDVVLKKGLEISYVMNDISKDRRELCLDLMLDQDMITQSAHDKAVKVPLKKMLNITEAGNKADGSSYFADYIIDEVINDLMEQKKMSYDEAFDLVYRQGLKIYSTMDSKAQAAVNKEFNNPDNFPGVTNIRTNSQGNVLDANGNVSLYAYSNYFNSKGKFIFKKNEYKWLDNGNLMIKYGKRFNIYETVANGVTDYSLEFKDLYYRDNGRFYTITGGYVTIPAEYKTVDKDFNLIIDKSFFKDYPDSFTKQDDGLILNGAGYSLNYSVVQPQGAMVIRDVHNGQIKAMIGGREINGEQLYNRALATRQPGSSIKPLGVYSAALQQSCELAKEGKKMTYTDYNNCKQGIKLYGDYMTAASAIDDEPMRLEGKIWPYNSDGAFHGLMSMRSALQSSINVVAVKILLQVGTDFSSKNIKNFGITSLTDDDLNPAALALGGMSRGVSPLEMSNAYTAFVNGGKVYESSCYTKVLDKDGKVLLEKEAPKSKQAIDPGVAFITRDMMFGVVSGGTGTSAAISGTRVGGKTGTTTDEYDIWFDGFTPSYAASLWIGNDRNMQLTAMSGYAAALWGRIMRQIPKAQMGSYSGAPSNVVRASVDADTGLAPGPGSRTKSEYFIKGTVPTIKDKYHGSIKICTQSGELATPSCTSTKTISGFRKPYASSKSKKSSSSSPEFYCHLHNPDVNSYPIDPDKKLKPQKEPATEPAEEE